jgi:hypothetical protein
MYDLPVTGVTRSLWHLRGLCAAVVLQNSHHLGHSHYLCSARPPRTWGPSSNTNKGFHLELPKVWQLAVAALPQVCCSRCAVKTQAVTLWHPMFELKGVSPFSKGHWKGSHFRKRYLHQRSPDETLRATQA